MLKTQFCVTWANGERSWGSLMEGGRIFMELAEDICNRAFKCQFSGDSASQSCPALVLIHLLRNDTSRSKDSPGGGWVSCSCSDLHPLLSCHSVWEQDCKKHSLAHEAWNSSSRSFAAGRTSNPEHPLSSLQPLEAWPPQAGHHLSHNRDSFQNERRAFDTLSKSNTRILCLAKYAKWLWCF